MCVDHEHHVNLSTDTWNNLCFKHAVLESLNGEVVTLDVETYAQGKSDCEKCDSDREDREGN